MAAAVFTVAQAGPLVSIQDRGRAGAMRFGVPASGPMDRFAFAIAQAVLGNRPDAAAIEVSLGGLTLECLKGDLGIAVAGGGFLVEIDGVLHGSWLAASLRAGSRLTIRPGPWGSWTYLAFAGDLAAKTWLGSAATHAASGLGGGRLAAGQVLHVEQPRRRKAREGEIACPVSARPRHGVHVVAGPQDRFFAAETIEAFLSRPFTLTDAYDRMGVRLSGPPLRPNAALDMPSEALVRGSVQVSGDGIATVLMADHQTTGGYPKIATIVSHHLDGFAQLRSRGRVAFTPVTAQAAAAAARTNGLRRRQFLAQLADDAG